MKGQTTTLSIYGFKKGFKKKLFKVAKQKGVSVSTLSRVWLTERLQAM